MCEEIEQAHSVPLPFPLLFKFLMFVLILERVFFIHNSGMRMAGTECIRNILFNLRLGAEWMEFNGVLSIPEHECGIKECPHFTFWPFSFQNCE